MKYYIFCFLMILSFKIYSQVGINTTNPSTASVLDVNSSSDGINFGGFMPPVIPSLSDRNSINAGISDIGLLIFLSDATNSNYCFQIWNGSTWENIYCIITPAIIDIATQDFDFNLSWTYTATPTFYNEQSGTDIWDIVNSIPDIFGLDGNFLGCRDLNNSDDGGSGGNFFHEIVFNNMDVSAYSNVQITFDYEVFEFDNNDDVQYELFLDETSQGIIQLIDGSSNYNESGTVTLNIPGGTTNVRLTLGVRQNGDTDTAGFDNFRIIGL